MSELAPILEGLLARGVPAVLVTVGAVHGSAPREPGARMLVHPGGIAGTIGGGMLEWRAIARARAMLETGLERGLETGEPAVTLELPLGPELGQCCGGRVRLDLVRADRTALARLAAEEAAARAQRPLVLLFGAGHVGQALVRALAPLPLRLRWIDPRRDLFPPDPPAGVETVCTAAPVRALAETPQAAACLVATHSHALDFELVAAALGRDDLRHLGLIGSATKRAVFLNGLRALGIPELRCARLVCPIGGPSRDKRPEVIALLAAAELWRAIETTPLEPAPR